MFAYFGGEFVEYLPDCYISKTHDLLIETYKNRIALRNHNENDIEPFYKLREILDGEDIELDEEGYESFICHDIPDFTIAEEPTIISYNLSTPSEEMFIGNNFRRASVFPNNDNNQIIIEVNGESESKCRQIRDIIIENFEEIETTSNPIEELLTWTSYIVISGGIELIDGIYRIKEDIKQIIMKSI